MDLSHLYIDILPDPGISSYANATLELGHSEGGRIALKYDPSHFDELGYLVAHECGHLIRMHSVPEDARSVPAITRSHRAQVIRDVGRDIRKLHRQGLPEGVLGGMVNFLHEGLVRQVMNYPADMRIEKWLRSEYQGLNGIQEKALRRQLEDNLKAGSSEVKEMAPVRMFNGANVMNAAYGRYMSRLLADRNLFSMYRRTEFRDEGRALADEIWRSEDRGYYSDIRDTERWAERLGVDRWFEWRRLSR